MSFRVLTCGLVIYDEITLVQNCVENLKNELKDITVFWIFVLNHPEKEIRLSLKYWIENLNLSQVTILENPSNNLGHARQLILNSTSTDWLYITDPDIEPKSQSVIKLFDQAQNANLAESTVGLGGHIQHTSKHYLINSTYQFIDKISQYFPFSFQIQAHKSIRYVDHLPACHLLLNVKKAKLVGGFSSYFERCGEDTAFTQACYNLNNNFLFIPTAQVVHYQNISFLKWLLKIFIFGRAQMTVNYYFFKQNDTSKLKLRWYRFLPLFLLLIFINFTFIYPLFAYVTLALLFLSYWITPGVFGFLLVIAAYSMGEIIEILRLVLTRRNEEVFQAKENKNQIELKHS